jgi:hypothetical protein
MIHSYNGDSYNGKTVSLLPRLKNIAEKRNSGIIPTTYESVNRSAEFPPCKIPLSPTRRNAIVLARSLNV